jgi:hypothetical protein
MDRLWVGYTSYAYRAAAWRSPQLQGKGAMDFWLAVVTLTTLGCGTGIVITAIDKIFDAKKRARQQELELARERLRLQELQLIELRRQNEALQQQLEWHNKLLATAAPETQARLQAPGGGSPVAPARGTAPTPPAG